MADDDKLKLPEEDQPLSDEEVFAYHLPRDGERAGKIAIRITKPVSTQRDLSIAYTPGVAKPCLEIADDPLKGYQYTAKGNLVAVISNGTAVLGLGDIGPLAGKPVMEGKGILFKGLADIDVFDIEIDSKDPEEIIRTVKMLEPTFGGINLEDIKAPECFEIETRLMEEMDIPVFHDDQHGTAIISAAGMLNALEINGKKMEDLQIVIMGAGAAGIAIGHYLESLGATHENILMLDSKGVLHADRAEQLNKYKAYFATERNVHTLEEAMEGADAFLGISVANLLTGDHLRRMSADPIVLAMANPVPEITYPEAVAARPDVIMGTGRSDYPNQVNNVLGFPFIFRGALDVGARKINDEMKHACTNALAELAHLDVPESVIRAYGGKPIEFGREYIIPKPLDPRVLQFVASAVAKAAIDTGVARNKIENFEAYKDELEVIKRGRTAGLTRKIIRRVNRRQQQKISRIAFPEGESERIIRACKILIGDGVIRPVLIGNRERVERQLKACALDTKSVDIVDTYEAAPKYVEALWHTRRRHGMTRVIAEDALRRGRYLGEMMLHEGDVDGLVYGITHSFPFASRPALQVIGPAPGVNRVCACHIVVVDRKTFVFADTSVQIEPSAQDLAEITSLTSEFARRIGLDPKVALLSYSDFGSAGGPQPRRSAEARALVREMHPDLIVEGEMQADTALDRDYQRERFPFSRLQGPANVLIFPDLSSANASYKLLENLGGAEVLGPIMLGMAKPACILYHATSIDKIVQLVTMTVYQQDRFLSRDLL